MVRDDSKQAVARPATKGITGSICAKGKTLAASGEVDPERVKAKIHRAAQSPVATPNEPVGQEGEVGTWSEGGIHYSFRFIGANAIPDAKGGHSDASPAKNNHLVVWVKLVGDQHWYPSASHNFWGRKAAQTSCDAADDV
jgi:hypothetical protein